MRIFKVIGGLFLAILLLLVLLVSAILLFKNEPPPAPKAGASLSEVESYIEALCSEGSLPGLSLLVVKDGAIKYSKGFGLADGPNNVAANSKTIYKWWSMTKIFTAMAILQLDEQKLLDINDPVTMYLPYFKVRYPSEQSEIVTIRHLLNHSSGMPDNVPEVMGWMHLENEPSLDQSDLAKEVFSRYAKLKFEPGKKSDYTNVGYMMLGAIIEVVSNQSYEDYVVEHLLKPVGAILTNFHYAADMMPYAATGSHPLLSLESLALPFLYDWTTFVRETVEGRIWFNRFLADSNPPTGLIGPITDLGRMMMAYLNKGELDGISILSAGSIDRMSYDGHIKSGGPIQSSASYRGLGWAVNKDENKSFYVTHGGGGPGFGSSMRLYPDENFGVAVIANDTNLDRELILNLMADLDW